MIAINGEIVKIGSYPDGTILMKPSPVSKSKAIIKWKYENEREFIGLIYLTKHLRDRGVSEINLIIPYIPNARMDRVKNEEDVFTLKYFAEIINSLNFNRVFVLDPHSSVSEALINNLWVNIPKEYINKAIYDCRPSVLFYPDEGAMKRYSDMSSMPYAFGIKKRDWETGVIQGIDVAGCVDLINGKDILIVDDICSRGGTFYHSAKKLKELGAKNIYLYITHCENTILDGELLTSGLIERVYTTNSIFTKGHEKIEVFEL